MKTLRIEALEKEIESLKKKNDERELRKMAEANHLNVKEELARVHEAKINEAASLKKKAKDIAAHYCHCLHGVGCDTQLPADYSTGSFMDWLLGEILALEGHMTLDHDFTMVTAFKAMCARLLDASCDNLEHLDLSDVDQYFQILAEANSIGGRFFNSFWSMGANDVAIMNAALSRREVLACLVYFSFLILFSLIAFVAKPDTLSFSLFASLRRKGGRFVLWYKST